MTTEQGPGARRRYLGKMLRRLRDEKGLTTSEVAKLLRLGQPTISRIENGRHAILPRNVYHMLEIYGVQGDRADWLIQVAEKSNERGWWESYSDTLPEWFEIYASLEGDAEEIWTYEAEFVPGLLQTPSYARAVRLAAHPHASAADLDRSVELRQARQDHLAARHLVAVINEAVIRRHVGGIHVMAEQLDHMTALAHDGIVQVHVLPYTAGAHPAMNGAFAMLRFPDTSGMDLVYIESERGGVYLERQADLARYVDVFSRIRATSLSVEESRDLMATVATELRTWAKRKESDDGRTPGDAMA